MKQQTNKNLCVAILLCIGFFAQAQKVDSVYKTLPKRSLIFSLMPTLNQPLKLYEYGKKKLYTFPSRSIQIGIDYQGKIKNKQGFSIGIHVNTMTVHYYFDLYVPEFNNLYNMNYSNKLHESTLPYFYFPLSIGNTYHKKNNISVKYSTGINVFYISRYESIFEDYFIGENNAVKNLFFMSINNQKPFFIGFFSKVGILKTTKRGGHSYGVNLLANYTPEPIGRGHYEFNNIPQKSYGDVEMRLNYIGLEYVQGVTLKKENASSLYKDNKLYYMIYDTLTPKSQLKISVMPMLFGGMKIKQESGVRVFESNPSPSIAGGITYYQTIKNKIGLNIGMQIGGIAQHEKINHFDEPSHINPNKHIRTTSHKIVSHYIGVFPSLQTILKDKKTHKYSGALGISGIYINPYKEKFNYSSYADLTPQSKYSNLDINISSTNKFAFGIFLKSGIIKNSENAGSSLEINLLAHFSPTTIAKGNYVLTGKPREGFGDGNGKGLITHSVNYIGLGACYALTLKKEKR